MLRVLAGLLRERLGLLRRNAQDPQQARPVCGAGVHVPGGRRLRVRDGLVLGEPAGTRYNPGVADDPSDLFDKIADDIQRRQDELDAADKLRSDKAAEKRKRKPDDATGATPESTQTPKKD